MLVTNFTKTFSPELSSVFEYMDKTMLAKYNIEQFGVEHFIFAVFENPSSDAYQVLNKILLESTIDSLRTYYTSHFIIAKDKVESSLYKSDFIDLIMNTQADVVTSAMLLSDIIQNNVNGNAEVFSQQGVVINELVDALANIVSPNEQGTTENTTIPTKHKKKKNVIKDSKTILNSVKEANEVDRNLVNLNMLAEEGKVEKVVGNSDIIESVFNVLCKKNKNNVLITGDSGIGKTATVKHIANLIVQGDVPKRFKNKTLVLMDFMTLVSNTSFRGSFESKFENIVRDASKGEYIFFLDDIPSILSDKSKFGEVDIVSVLDKILLDKNIGFIATCSNQGYRTYFENNPSLSRKFQRINMTQPSVDEAIKIVHAAKTSFELFHNVEYTDEAIETSVKLASRYISQAKLPDSALDLIDETAARKVLWMKTPEGFAKYQAELDKILAEKEEVNNSDTKDYDKIDDLTKQEITIKSKISKIEKETILSSPPVEINENDIRIVVARKTNIPIQQITTNDKVRLKNIDETLKQYVVGQDEAVDAVSRVIKRQRVGIANPNKPAVMLFVGHTGTGKTYLAKKIAQEVFGDEKYLVRFDMSEYADKMAVNKLYGSAPGYVGYEQGGQLTEAIKKNKYCVLLLDEIEKADEDVHNVFLQMFDEGRLTDNMGVTVDFKNVIVIMTSNVGARMLNERGNGLGFTFNEQEVGKSILDSELKKKFKPEFLNRINRVIFFNKLTDDNLRSIVTHEINNVGKKLETMGYSLDGGFAESPVAEEIYREVSKDKTYGARPVLREIENKIEDIITDYVLTHDVEKGHVFTYNELYH